MCVMTHYYEDRPYRVHENIPSNASLQYVHLYGLVLLLFFENHSVMQFQSVPEVCSEKF